jgi:hypothetical protein
MYNAACGTRHPMSWLSPTHWVSHITSCIIQSNAPDDWQNYCLEHVELIGIY